MTEGSEKSQVKKERKTPAPPAPAPMTVVQKVPTHLNDKGGVEVAVVETPTIPSLEENKKTVEDFKKDKDNRRKAAEIAQQIKNEFPTWFTAPKLMKPFKANLDEVTRTLEMLMLFNFCVGKVENKVPLFRIDLDHKVQRELIIKEIEEKEGQILFLKKKLAELD